MTRFQLEKFRRRLAPEMISTPRFHQPTLAPVVLEGGK
jgi:hypothetical protein